MAKKYLLLDNEIIAKQKAHGALEKRFPNRRALQLEKHLQNPKMYLHPDECNWDNDCLHGWKKDPLGRCEIECDDVDTQYYEGDQGKFKNTQTIQDDDEQ